jgi:hypothetical protein
VTPEFYREKCIILPGATTKSAVVPVIYHNRHVFYKAYDNGLNSIVRRWIRLTF